MKHTLVCLAFLILLVVVVESSSDYITLVQTSEYTDDRLTEQPDVEWTASKPYPVNKIQVDTTQTRQKVLGFGGAFTDAAAYNFWQLSDSERERFLNDYWGEEGLGYTVGRIPIHSCDFTRYTYSFDEVDGDFDLEYFEVGDDTEDINMALSTTANPIKFYASPWSPPTWMKIEHSDQTAQGMNGSAYPLGLIQEDDYFQSWALYFSKWIDEYTSHGIDIWGVTPQNEPQALQSFESCLFTAEAEKDFIKDYLGPQLENDWPDVKIIAWDHNKYSTNTEQGDYGPTDHIMTDWVNTMYTDTDAAQYVDGIGFHWYQVEEGDGWGFDVLNESYYMMPEGTCGTPDLDNWYGAEMYGIDIMGDLNNWAVGWVDWNLLLDLNGGPTHIDGEACEAPLILDNSNGTYYTLPKYYYLGHYSKYLRPDSYIVEITTSTLRTDPWAVINGVAAVDDDGQVSVVVINPTDDDITFLLEDVATDRMAECFIPQHSIQTYQYS